MVKLVLVPALRTLFEGFQDKMTAMFVDLRQVFIKVCDEKDGKNSKLETEMHMLMQQAGIENRRRDIRVLKKMVGKLNRSNFCSMPDRKFYPSSF